MRRSREDITTGILKSCITHKLSVSQLMATQNLSHKMLKSLLEHLVSIRLIEVEVDGRRKSFCTTEQGVVALRCYRNAIAMLKGSP